MPIYYDRYGRPIRTAAMRPAPVRIPVDGHGQQPGSLPEVSPAAHPAHRAGQLEQYRDALLAARDYAQRLEAELALARSEVGALQAELAAAAKPQPQPPVQADDEAYREKYLRLAADFENSRKRLERNYAQQAQEDKERVLRDVLPLADNLERALAHAEGEDGDALRQGVELTLRAFNDALARHGVRPIRPRPGEAFDPRWHEAIAVLPGRNIEPGSIAHVQEIGYALDEKLLRPARVVVAGEEA